MYYIHLFLACKSTSGVLLLLEFSPHTPCVLSAGMASKSAGGAVCEFRPGIPCTHICCNQNPDPGGSSKEISFPDLEQGVELQNVEARYTERNSMKRKALGGAELMDSKGKQPVQESPASDGQQASHEQRLLVSINKTRLPPC